MPKVFKVWSHNRTQRKSFLLREDGDELHNLIRQASVKFKIAGEKLVLEKDGTEVDEDKILNFFNETGEVFLVLEHNQHWERGIDNSTLLMESEGNLQSTVQSTSNGDKEIVIHPPTTEIQIPNVEVVEPHERHDQQRQMDEQPTVDEEHKEVDGQVNETVQNQEPNLKEVWENFKFNWNSCSVSRINELKQGLKTGELIRYFVHQSVDQMRDISTNIPQYAIGIVAKQIVAAYPNVFEDKNLRNEKLGQGCHTIASKMINRNNNLNRPKEGKTLTQELGIKCKNLSRLKMAQSGCKNWQPEIKLPYENLEAKRVFLVDWIRSLNVDENMDPNVVQEPAIIEKKKQEAEKKFLFTFAHQRRFLNNLEHPPTVEDILDLWPIMFNMEFYFWHYELLMGHSIHKLEEELKKSQCKIFTFGYQNHLTSKTEISDEEVLRIISKRFSEDHDQLFIKFNDDTPIEEFVTPENAFGWVASTCSAEKFHFFIQRHIIFPDCTFLTALKILFASFFIFNKPFPKKNSVTLDFIQRNIMNISLSDKGNKATAPKCSMKKVISFSNALNKTHVIEEEIEETIRDSDDEDAEE